jgi:hypothetical protein
MQYIEHLVIVNALPHEGDGVRIFNVSSGCRSWQQQVPTHRLRDAMNVFVRESETFGDRPCDRRPNLAVITWETFADVVKECRNEEQVGTSNAPHVIRGCNSRHQQMPINGVDVDWVALWT